MDKDRKFVYIGDFSFEVNDINHEKIYYLEKGHILIKSPNGSFQLSNGVDVLVTPKLARFLRPNLTTVQTEYYTRLRNTAAANAMQAMLSSDEWKKQIEQETEESIKKRKGEDFSDILVDYAVMYADKLTQRLVKEGVFYPETLKEI